MQFTLLLSLVALTLAGYAVDFDYSSPRDAGSSFWLEDGSWEANVAGRTDLNTSFLEVHLNPVDPNVDCWWSLWSDDVPVTSGVFRSATSSVVSILSGTIPNGGEVLKITTSGCWLGRYATPFQLGDNDGGLWLADVTPQTQAALWTPADTFPTMTNKLDAVSYRNQLEALQAGQGLCRFNDQACNAAVYAPDSLTSGYWATPGGGNVAQVLVTWNNSQAINATDEVVIEASAWFQNSEFLSFSICNTSLTCADSYSPDWLYDTSYWSYLNFNSQPSNWGTALPKKRALEDSEDAAYVGPDPLFAAFATSTMNSTRNFGRFNYAFEPTNQLFSGVAVGFGPNSIVPPYVKVWGLGGGYSAAPIHTLINLRGQLGSQCEEQGFGTNIGFQLTTQPAYPVYGCPQETSSPNAVSSGQDNDIPGSTFGQADQTNWFWCGQSSSLHGNATLSCSELNAFSVLTTTTQVQTAPVDISTYSFPNGGFITPVVFDMGVPCVDTPTCANPQAALNQLSWFDIEFDGASVGSTRQFFIDNFDSNQIRGDGVGGFVFGASPSTIQYVSAGSFSITATSFVPVTAFPTSSCNASDCLNGGWCASDVATECSCQIPWTGATCDQRAALCPADDSLVCWNGGQCLDNPAATYSTSTVNGVEAAVFANLFICNCTGTQANQVNGTGDFYGQYCQYSPPCDSNPCFNDGVCINEGQDQFTCDCSLTRSPNSTKPFNGTLCEISQTTTCDINPCENGGICDPAESTAEASGYKCTCVGGWGGATCALPPTNGCASSNTCGSYGVCIPSSDDTNAFTQCVCLYGWSGPTCAVRPTACTDGSCENGGTCVGFYGTGSENVNCLCPHPWVGQHCQWNSTAYNSATSQFAGLFIVFVALLANLL